MPMPRLTLSECEQLLMLQFETRIQIILWILENL